MSKRKWHMTHDRTSQEYIEGIESFLKIAVQHRRDSDGFIRCPCRDCLNHAWLPIETIKGHLIRRGMAWSYTTWIHHGETSHIERWERISSGLSGTRSTQNEENVHDPPIVEEVINDDGPTFEDDADQQILADLACNNSDSEDDMFEDNGGDGIDMDKWSSLLEKAECEVYPGCNKFSLLSAVIQMMHIKVESRQSIKSFNDWLRFVKSILPEGERLPSSYYECRSMLRQLGMDATLIHACKNNCILFWKEYQDLNNCPRCNHSRWAIRTNEKKKRVPEKVLRYFPLIPRLQRLFMCRKTAPLMRWHKEGRVTKENGTWHKEGRVTDENMLRHPSDSEAWKELDQKFPNFGSDPRNVRLGLAADGFNPFGDLSTSYSIWPVILLPYNVPPWTCMKEPYLFMSMLIPGPRSPGKDIDVFLQPLVDELKKLWVDGVKTFDVVSGQSFRLHAALLWTIHDFPAYGDVSGWTTKGYKACPICNVDITSEHRQNKFHYMGHRRFLPMNHKWRHEKSKFDGKVEKRVAPRQFSNEEILMQLSQYEHVILGKAIDRRKRKRSEDGTNWCKKSILFKLPYWGMLPLRHNLDVMHIERNICDSLAGTILNFKGKSKDTEKARITLQEMGIRPELHLQRGSGRIIKPLAQYTLAPNQVREVCSLIKDVKLPDGYASNISACLGASEASLIGLKSHDCHVLLERILPVVLRGHLRDDIHGAISEMSRFFRELCAKELKVDVLESLEKSIVMTLCKLEMIFPPAFFDVMIHLAVHLPREARLGGPVQYRWMYPVERYLGVLKGYVKNKARPEGSIAEAYVVRENLTFCSMYFENIDSRFNRPHRQWDDYEQPRGNFRVFSQPVRPMGSCTYAEVDEEINKMHWYVLNNCEEVHPYIREFEEELQERYRQTNVQQLVMEQFPAWFKNKIIFGKSTNTIQLLEDLDALSWGPQRQVQLFQGCVVNRVRFITKDREAGLRSQNSGVIVLGGHDGDTITFYGTITSIIQLNYTYGRRVFLFKCKWYDTHCNKPELIDGDMVTINTGRTWYENDPYILVDQAQQVFYLKDPKKCNGDWKVVQKVHHRYLFHRELFQSHDSVDNEIIDQPQLDEPLQQERSGRMIEINRIFIDLGQLARVPESEESLSLVSSN